MDILPRGTVTFLATDLEGSTRSWETQPEAMARALSQHDALVRSAIEGHGGAVFKHTGDGVLAAFGAAVPALRAALAVWRALTDAVWEGIDPLRARMALHTGVAELRGEDYFGTAVNRCARLLGITHGGQIVCSRTSAELCRDDLPREVALVDLGAHRLRDLSRPEHVFEIRFPEQHGTFPRLRSLDAFPHNLPIARTTFVGREREIAAVGRLVETHRLVTLIGVGGVGKTRLGMQIAADLVARFPDGVFFVELAALSEPSLIAHAIAVAVGMTPGGGAPRAGGGSLEGEVARFLEPQRALLVLDNCEHVIGPCAHVADVLLTRCPALHLVATSRERLGIEGESVWLVPPMAVPAAAAECADDLVSVEAVRLFGERAAAAGGFALTAATAPPVAEICTRLDGIPLAIELAAARTRHLSPEDILARLNDRFRLLTGGGRTTMARQQTLRATMDWSHQLLDEAEQILLRRLAVFVDGFSLPAAEAICAGDLVERAEVLARLASLVDKSLVMADVSAGETRYRLLETVQQYAAAKLDAAGEADWLGDRHRDFFAAYADAVELHDYGSLMNRSTRLLEPESANLRAALERALRSDAHALALGLAARLWGCWWTRGRYEDALGWLGQALAGDHGSPTEPRLAAMLGMTALHIMAGHFDLASQWCDEVRREAQAIGSEAVLPAALAHQSSARLVEGGDAEAPVVEAIERATRLGDGLAAADALWQLADVRLLRGDSGDARRLIAEALRRLDSYPGEEGRRARYLCSRCIAAHLQGDHADAVTAGEEAVALAHGRYAHWGSLIATACAGAAVALAAIGQTVRASALLVEALQSIERSWHPLADADCLMAVGAAAVLHGDIERGGRLLGAARTLMRANGGSWRNAITGALYVHYVNRVRGALPVSTGIRIRDEGRALSRDAALVYARSLVRELAQ